MYLPRPRSLRAWAAVAAVALLLVVAAAVTWTSRSAPAVTTEDVQFALPEAPGSTDQVNLDARLYVPEQTPAPAVLLAHGFGGSKDSVAAQARDLAEEGFVVLAYSARGFGRSTGQISLNDPDREVADARAMVDWLAGRTEVRQDGPHDPRVGVTGGSYGGALALTLGGTDQRIDAIAASITWNDLGQALFPNFGTPGPVARTTPAAAGYGGPGVLKRGWAGIFFGAGAGGTPDAGAGPAPGSGPCGRFLATICQAYAAAAETGRPSPELLAMLTAHSPAAVIGAVTAPTLLVQGEQDTLFGLDQADANARQIAAAGAPVQVRWFPGGHDAGGDSAPSQRAVAAFLSDRLGDGEPDTRFVFTLPGAPTDQGAPAQRRMTAPDYPGLGAVPTDPTPTISLPMIGSEQTLVRPPGASPAGLSSVPGLGASVSNLASAAGPALDLAADPPGQSARFATAPLGHPLTVTGTSTVTVEVSTLAAPGAAVLFAKLYDVSPQGRRTLPGGAVAAIRLPDAPAGQPVPLTVTLPGIAHQVPEGHHLELVLAATDQAYANPLSPAQFTVALTDPAITVPSVPATTNRRALPVAPLVGIGAILTVVALLGIVGAVRSRRRAVAAVDPALLDTPLVVTDLHKSYDNGFRAVDGVSFTVRRGQVLGLLGPNGAGKTTTLRMLMGLITPSSGELRVFGHQVTPGAPVLSRLGSFVEGSGLLPHLSGLDNLRLYWEATGRPAAEARMDEALEIADLGDAVHRKVRSYSQGMRQRLALAQAMLGLPDLMVLDEPTNGLDPPQIRTMREVLVAYARTGRTVLVSSHLLAEVEQTCTDVVVMNHGRVIAAGTVEELTSAEGATELRVDDAARAVEVLDGLDGPTGVHVVEGETPTVRLDLGATDPTVVVRALVESGVGVRGLSGTTRLEDVFLRLVHVSDHREHDAAMPRPRRSATSDSPEQEVQAP
ncbi:alpha/beta fold hydrolase [Rhodococcus tukisamuensis]|uniref:ABC-2 type transport system ATP-binding protein n=1 Tax=Rhodococcus tukisamuensis TaxID=168276 RepID=A0A1G6Z957_9NOCA|nr:alpha/beta fold hydrolase [Rhodococcus tukisamuensis]SDD98415.1 ABC-2 type transport system ATP-binding protein [Rhodococcus tukisamuensis]